ncbi:MAG TPA: hypothetical protein VNX65_00340 [Patescibacteria group bacterium]|nr:hypothetical protein [Patescibacteria group bacterium]
MAIISLVSLLWSVSLNNKLIKRPSPKIYEIKMDSSKILTDTDMKDVRDKAQKQLSDITEQATSRLQQSLNNTVDGISARLNDMTETSLSQEFEKYQVSLEALREQSIEEFSKLQKELDTRRNLYSEQLDKKVVAEFKKRMELFDGRLNDVVSTYLVESLGNQVDFGAQANYIISSLEANKDVLKKDILE